MNIVLYTTHCMKCKALEKKLADKGIEYEEVSDIETLQEMGLMSVPYLKVDDNMMDFGTAVKWVNARG